MTGRQNSMAAAAAGSLDDPGHQGIRLAGAGQLDHLEAGDHGSLAAERPGHAGVAGRVESHVQRPQAAFAGHLARDLPRAVAVEAGEDGTVVGGLGIEMESVALDLNAQRPDAALSIRRQARPGVEVRPAGLLNPTELAGLGEARDEGVGLAHAGHGGDGRAGIEVRSVGEVAGEPHSRGADRHGGDRIFFLAPDPAAPEDGALRPEPRQESIQLARAFPGGAALLADPRLLLEAPGHPDLAIRVDRETPRLVVLRTADPLRPLQGAGEVELRREPIGFAGAGETAWTRVQRALERAGHVDAPGVHRDVQPCVLLETAEAAGPHELAARGEPQHEDVRAPGARELG